jgi:hypothetical protein
MSPGRLLRTLAASFEGAGVEIITNYYNNFNCHVSESRFDFRNTSLNVFIHPRFDAAAAKRRTSVQYLKAQRARGRAGGTAKRGSRHLLSRWASKVKK